MPKQTLRLALWKKQIIDYKSPRDAYCKCMLGERHKDTDGRRAADGEIDGQKQTEMEEVKEEPEKQERIVKETTQIVDHGKVQ